MAMSTETCINSTRVIGDLSGTARIEAGVGVIASSDAVHGRKRRIHVRRDTEDGCDIWTGEAGN